MALSPGEMHNRIIENLPEKMGHALAHWLNVLDGVFERLPACLLHRDHVRTAETEIGPEQLSMPVLLHFDSHGNDPAACAGWIDNQTKPVPIPL